MKAAGLTILTVAAFACVQASAQTNVVVPAVTVYPRETVRADMLEIREGNSRLAGAEIVTDPSQIIGKVSRTTLLPGRPIALNALEAPRIVAVGARVRIVFRESGVAIVALGVALQPGGEGEIIRVRNLDSQIVVTGIVRRDGSVDVGLDG